MICRRCGQNAPDGLFCALCGAKQDISRTAKKRGNGQGTAFKRGKTWTAMRAGYSYVDDGKLKRRRPTKGGFKTKKEALEWANRADTPEAPLPKLIELWQGWSENDMLKLSESKQGAYKIARRRLEPVIGRRIDTLTVDDLQNCINKECSSYCTAKDVRHLLSHLYRRAMASNTNHGRVFQNLSQFLVMPEQEEKEAVPFTEDEVKRFWDAYESGDRFVGYILLLCYSGMMPLELRLCKKDMVDLDACEIRGCGVKTKVRKKAAIVFPDFLKPVVKDLLTVTDNDSFLGMNKDRFYDAYYDALERCGVRRLTPYACRHTYGTESVKMGLHPAIIQRLLRHSDSKTQEKYTHLASDDIHEAINQMNRHG